MYSKHKYVLLSLFVASYVFFWFLNFDITDLSPNILTIVSIILGFYIAALSTVCGTKYSKKMANQVDNRFNTKTQLQTLLDYFSISIKIGIMTIFSVIAIMLCQSKLIYICQTEPQDKPELIQMVFNTIIRFSSPVAISLLICNFICMWLIFKTFKNAIKFEAQDR